MLKLLDKKARKALVKTNFKGNLRKQTIRKRFSFIRKAHAFIINN